MSRSFAILLREARLHTPDPERPGKMLTQPRAATLIGVCLESYRKYEQSRSLPHPLVRREIFRLWPDLCSTD